MLKHGFDKLMSVSGKTITAQVLLNTMDFAVKHFHTPLPMIRKGLSVIQIKVITTQPSGVNPQLLN